MNKRFWTTLCVAGLLFGISAVVSPDRAAADKPSGRVPPTAEMCALLDNPRYAGRMDGLLNYLAKGCGRSAEFFGTVAGEANEPGVEADAPFGVDVAVSDPSGDDDDESHTQSETSIARNETTGTVCAAWNDSQHGIPEGLGFSGFGRSTDGGATFEDRGPVSTDDSGDPSLVWRKSDGKFYYAALRNGGLGLYRSDDDCTNFVFVSAIASGSDDKEIMAVDNNPANPSYGYLYVVWTDFGSGARIFATRSTDAGATWSAQLGLSAVGEDVQGAWPVVAPNGHVYAGWVHWMGAGFPDGNVEAQVSRSTDGGATWALVTPPMTNQINPQNSTASGNCGRPALNGNIRYLPSPTIAVDSLGRLHAVYTYDAAGFGTGDSSNVYYRRSTDGGATWGTQVLINDDATATDQYQPSLSIGAGDVLAIGYYSRQNDVPNNLLLDYYSRVSYDGGGTWQASTRLSDVSTPVFIDPNLAACYHGDYDTQIHVPGKAIYLWSDDRNIQGGHNDPDIYADSTPAGIDFLVLSDTVSRSVCAGPAVSTTYDVDVFQFQGFSETVTLSASGNPAPSTTGFAPPSVIPPGSSTLTVSSINPASPGTSTITITGTSSPGAIVHATTVDLTVFTATAGVPSLTTPADGAIDQILLPTFTWSLGAQATTSQIDVATDSGFTNIVFTASGIAGTSRTLTSPLTPLTQYYWRVRSTNECGTSTFSSEFDFTTRAIPPTLLVDDDNNAPDVRATFEGLMSGRSEAFDVWNTNGSTSEPTAGDLAPYKRVLWFSGDAFGSSSAGPSLASQTALQTWLDTDTGNCLFLDSQDFLFDFTLNPFMQNYLGVATENDDEGHTTATGANFFHGGPYTLSFPADFTNYSDVVTAGAGALVAYNGSGGTTNGAGSIFKDDKTWKTILFTIPLEAFPLANQAAVLDRVLLLCDAIFQDGFDLGNDDRWDSSTQP